MIDKSYFHVPIGWLPSIFHLLHISPATTILSILSGSFIAYYLHLRVSQRVMNNFYSSEPWDPETELVLITGGGSGIGRQIMEDLSNKQTRVVVLDIQTPAFEIPENVTFYQTDITSTTAVSEVASTIRQVHGEPTVLVNNAGVFQHGSILEKSERDIRQTFEVNNIAHFRLLKEFLPSMIQANRGHIVTVASIASFVAVGEMVDYCCSKAGALAFHEGLRQELKYWYQAPNVRTSIVHPLWVQTPMIKGFTDYQTDFGQPILSPQDVSQAVVDHIVCRKSGQIILPKALSAIGSLRASPLWLQEPARSFFSKIVRHVRNVRLADQGNVTSEA